MGCGVQSVFVRRLSKHSFALASSAASVWIALDAHRHSGGSGECGFRQGPTKDVHSHVQVMEAQVRASHDAMQ